MFHVYHFLREPTPTPNCAPLSVGGGAQAVVKAFFAGEFNCLVATCIAEEGLDIGEVDLIVSFDALSSPVRMVQRMGRTGRKRAGKARITRPLCCVARPLAPREAPARGYPISYPYQ